jgi:poly-beta-1,6-N-acetyl-D-glucosamine synthase
MEAWLLLIERTWFYLLALVFFGLYPVLTAIIWATTALVFYFRRDRRNRPHPKNVNAPLVSVLVPAYREEAVIAQAVSGALAMNYPRFELIVINDGSTDRTVDEVRPFLADRRVRLIDKQRNEGKALALNDGIAQARGELLLILDADAVPDAELLNWLVPHFQSPTVGAVAGNARVRNKTGILARLQAIEFTSVIGLLRRAQRVWGAVMCVSGVVGIFRASALREAGLFTPGMATEDIDLTWKIQKLGYDVRYEPRALVWMIVPESISMWWRQRRRWALGLGQVLRRHKGVIASWKMRRMFPLYLESTLSTLWALSFLFITAFWIVSFAAGHVPRGGSPVPNLWGMLLVTVCLIQLACGILIDFRYEPGIVKQAHLSPLYPLAYWFLLAVAASIYTVRGLCQRLDLEKPTRWHIERTCKEIR